MRLFVWNEKMFTSLYTLPQYFIALYGSTTSNIKEVLIFITCFFCALCFSVNATAKEGNHINTEQILTLHKAIYLSHKHDIWLVRSNAIESGLTDKSIAFQALPDPTLSMSILNLPSDGFDFNQEPMTQMKIGISQLFPRGDTLALQKQRHLELANEQPLLRADRRAKTELTVTRLWLSAFQAQASTILIEDNRALFVQLIDIASTSYSSLVGKGRQQDIIGAEVELSRLNDRLIQLNGLKEASEKQLSEWLVDEHQLPLSILDDFRLPEELPNFIDIQTEIGLVLEANNYSLLIDIISDHPLVKAKAKQIEASQSDVEISKQQHKPQWGVNASYAYRDDDAFGRSRADFFSVGLNLKIPIFSHKGQDANVSFAIRESEAKRTEKQLLLRELAAGLGTAKVNYSNLLTRKILYQNKIIPQLSQQYEALLSAYTSDDGDFGEVTQIKIAELNAKLTLLEINIKLRKNVALMQYYITHKVYKKESNYE